MNTKLIAEFIAGDRRRRELKDVLKSVEITLKGLEEEILAAWEQDGTSQIRVDGVLVFLKSQLWPKQEAEKFDIVMALGMHEETSWLVQRSYNASKLAGWMRELPKDDQGLPELPDHMKSLLSVSERFSIQTKH